MGGSHASRSAILLLVLLFIDGCTGNEPPSGPPTPLGKKDPMSVVCEIQREFKKLNKPVFTKIKYHEPWTESRIGAGTTHFSEYYEVFLSKEAYKFLEKHSPLEISTSLSPLIIEEENGADALTIMYAMAFHGQRRNLNPLFPGFIFAKYKDVPFPKEYLAQFAPGHNTSQLQEEVLKGQRNWGTKQRLRYLIGNQVIGQFTSDKKLTPNTLEQRIVGILDDLAAIKPKWNNPEWFDCPDLNIRIVNFESVLNATPVYPTVGEKFKEFRRAHDAELTATVLLSQANMITLGVLLDIHERYWPIYTKNWPPDGIPRHEAYLYRNEMENEIATIVHNYCNDEIVLNIQSKLNSSTEQVAGEPTG